MPERRPYMRRLTSTTADDTLVPYGSEGLHLPTRYAVEVDDPKCPLLLQIHVAVVDGQPQCAELRCLPKPGGPPVSSERLRLVPLRRYLRESTAHYALDAVLDEHGEVMFAAVLALDGRDLPRIARAAKPRHQVTDELLRDVSRVYSEAGSKPTLAVMRHFHTSRPTAGRWLALARKRGHLPEVTKKASKR